MNLLQNLFNLALLLLLSLVLSTECDAQAQSETAVATLHAPPFPPLPPRTVVLSFASHPPAGPNTQDVAGERTELHRTLIKSYAVTANDALSINNHFGDVSVALWDRNELRVEISIMSASDDPDRAKRALDAVTIDEQRNGNEYGFKTVIGDAFSKGVKRNDRSTNQLRVDYRISMPKANALTIRNKFGNVTLPNFSAPLTVDSQFGNVYGSALSNALTKINASFGNVTIRDVQNGNVKMSFGDLDINTGNVLSIVQEYGKLRIGQTNRVDARVSYADAVIGAIRQSGTLKMNYTKLFRLDQLAASADQLNVVANFSTVALPVQPQTNCDFDVTVTHGGFSYPTLPNLRLTAQPPQAPAAPRPGKRQQYVGRIGTGEGPRIKVVSVFGDVKFK